MRYLIFTLLLALIGFGFAYSKKNIADHSNPSLTGQPETADLPLPVNQLPAGNHQTVALAEVNAAEYVDFAKTLLGTPYLYGSVDPTKGFDCSGFINYVSRHFGIKVPRSSKEFTNYGKTVDSAEARPGDLILFTGTDETRRVVGHIGIIIENNGNGIEFIHSSSGKAKGVTISELEGYYQKRFVKVVRIIEDAAVNNPSGA